MILGYSYHQMGGRDVHEFEEAAVAARDCRIWSRFLRQAAGADEHDAVW